MYFLVCCLRDRMISVYVMNLNVLGEIINRDIIDKRKRKLRLFIEGKLILMKFFFLSPRIYDVIVVIFE